jgi:hypothetical protein
MPDLSSTDDAEHYCENGSFCREGSTCVENECKCPDNSYFLGKYQQQGESACQELNETFYILEESFGYSESFEYLKAARLTPIQPEFFPDTVRIELYPTKYERNPDKLPIFLNLEVKDTLAIDGNGLLIASRPKTFAPFPFDYIGVDISSERKMVKMAWSLKATKDSFIISADMYPESEYDTLFMKQVYLPYE